MADTKTSAETTATDLAGAYFGGIVENPAGTFANRKYPGRFVADARNEGLSESYLAKLFGTARRTLNRLCDGFADSSGVNGSRSANQSVDTTAKCVKATLSGTATYDNSNKSSGVVLSNGNLTFTGISGAGYVSGVKGTVGHSSTGKYYFEVTIGAVGGAHYIGVSDNASINGLSTNGGWNEGYVYAATGTRYVLTTGTGSWGSTYTTGDVIGVAMDFATGSIWFSKNGTWQASGNPAAGTGAAATGLTGTKLPYVGGTGSPADTINFGTTAFATAAPSGFGAWSPPTTNNLTYSVAVQTADATMTTVVARLEIDPVTSVTLNTDIVATATADNWSHGPSATLTNIGKGQSGRTVIEATWTGLTGGTQFAAEFTGANNKDWRVYAADIEAFP